MIKKFETYINEDYFSKLANRKDTGNVRKENEITEEIVLSVLDETHAKPKSITIRKEGNKTVVDVVGDAIYIRQDIEEIPFQFGKVTGDFNCYGCKLKSLKGCPEEVSGHFYCYSCDNLTSLEGCPKKIGGYMKCSWCEKLASLEGCPEEVGGNFICVWCGGRFSYSEIRSMCDVKGAIELL